MRVTDFEVQAADGTLRSLGDFAGQVLLIVNTASRCGFTPQYAGLEQLQRRYGAQGFSVLAFPCNQFGAQEPGDATEIAHFCTTRYDVSFPVFAKLEVNGTGASPLFEHLKAAAPGLLGSKGIKWNFTKFLVNRDGGVVGRHAPTAKPEDLAAEIEALL
ncbi:glutathione peroxidase [Sphingomonas sp. SORGH_AS802]|uniref:glutathione peroxidase n=1 Tax=unclassified Sphingomonas TaxID=196159 RepID=UPI0028657173|nr:glutathione peroxidase [Sphingomonas sp. SORGH_AS_0438]MDR6134987.1 glutathione peroxidase [Sphingomonas sp. SORGH_AS_0802]